MRNVLVTLFEIFGLGARTLVALFKGRRIRLHAFFEQCYQIGNCSLPSLLIAITFTGSVVVLEYAYHVRFVLGTAELVPGFAVNMIVREFGAGIAALLLASRAGAGIASELATMKNTEQIAALELMGIDILSYLVLPRFAAYVLMMLVLSAVALAAATGGGFLISVTELGFNGAQFISQVRSFVSSADLIQVLLKALLFGMIVPTIACYFGMNAAAGAKGVGDATTKAVVYSAVAIIVSDFIATYLFSLMGFGHGKLL